MVKKLLLFVFVGSMISAGGEDDKKTLRERLRLYHSDPKVIDYYVERLNDRTQEGREGYYKAWREESWREQSVLSPSLTLFGKDFVGPGPFIVTFVFWLTVMTLATY